MFTICFTGLLILRNGFQSMEGNPLVNFTFGPIINLRGFSQLLNPFSLF